MGSRNDFDKDLDSYLTQRKGKSIKVDDVIEWLRKIVPKKPIKTSADIPPDVETYEEEIKEEKQEDIGVVENLENDYEDKKSFLNKIIEKLNSFKKNPVEKEAEMATELEEEKIKDLVEKEMILQDMRDLAKITFFVIKQLPHKDKKQFKNSSDFDDLKSLLQKHGLIK